MAPVLTTAEPAAELQPAQTATTARRAVAPPPLAVRRRAPDSSPQRARVKTEPARKLGPFDRDLLEDLQRIEAEGRASRRRRRSQLAEEMPAVDRATPRCRGDRCVRCSARSASPVVWFTLRWCDLTLGQAGILPVAPLVAFFVLIVARLPADVHGGRRPDARQDGAWAFASSATCRMTPRTGRRCARPCYRAVLTLPSVFALGLGFLPALVRSGPRRARSSRAYPRRPRMKRLGVLLATSLGAGYSPVASGHGRLGGRRGHLLVHAHVGAAVAGRRSCWRVSLIGIWACDRSPRRTSGAKIRARSSSTKSPASCSRCSLTGVGLDRHHRRLLSVPGPRHLQAVARTAVRAVCTAASGSWQTI